MSLTNVLIAIAVIAVITFFTRAFPFLFFNNGKPPQTVLFLGKYIPPVIITILVFYCLKDISWTKVPYGSNEIAVVLLVVMLHTWKRNPLLSIFGATAVYMMLLKTGIVNKVLQYM